MHLYLILLAAGLASFTRLCWPRGAEGWADRWQRTLEAFLLPPSLLLVMGITVLMMGHHGLMLRHPVGWLGCHIVLGFLAVAGGSLAYFFWQQGRSRRQLQTLQSMAIVGKPGRVLETPTLFAAQVGIWNPQLVVSRGLLESLSPDQLEAVLSHEEAHYHYRDTLSFFWLNWVRQLTFWLPNTEFLWQELLLLRELRADAWAAQRVDALTLAETLLLVVRSTAAGPHHPCTAFYEATASSRLEERIDFLLAQPEMNDSQHHRWIWLLPLTLPLVLLPFHG